MKNLRNKSKKLFSTVLAVAIIFSMFCSCFTVMANSTSNGESGSKPLEVEEQKNQKGQSISAFFEKFQKTILKSLEEYKQQLKEKEEEKKRVEENEKKEIETNNTNQNTSDSYVDTETSVPAEEQKNIESTITQSQPVETPCPAGINQDMLNLINQLRSQNGLNPLHYSSTMQTVANIRAQEASTLWSHQRPNGLWPNSLSDNVMRENLAYDKGVYDAYTVYSNWCTSADHFQAMLHAGDTSMAIAYFEATDGNVYWALEIGND